MFYYLLSYFIQYLFFIYFNLLLDFYHFIISLESSMDLINSVEGAIQINLDWLESAIWHNKYFYCCD